MSGFSDAETGGVLRVELTRLDTQRWKLGRRFAWQGGGHGEAFVCPRDLDWESDLASIPWFFQWIVPPQGDHFPAILLHDALVQDGSEPEYVGPRVDRDEADRVMRLAMADLGVGFVRRWLAWTGANLATAWADSSPGRWWRRSLLVVTFGLITLLGAAATVDLFDAWDLLPWMGDRAVGAELGLGALFAILIPLALSVFWGRRWRLATIGGVALAFVLHITVAMWAVWLLYRVAEWLMSDLLGW